MGLLFHHLDDPVVHRHMVDRWREELADLKANYPRDEWPYGRLLTDEGWRVFEEVMPQALMEHDDEWLEAQMTNAAFWQDQQRRRKPKGGFTWVNYDKADALRRLAMGEFNTAYVRGLASALLERGVELCTVYRAGQAAEPRRMYCTDLEETTVLVQQIFDDHRAYFPSPRPGAQPIPSGPNCHHSIRR